MVVDSIGPNGALHDPAAFGSTGHYTCSWGPSWGHVEALGLLLFISLLPAVATSAAAAAAAALFDRGGSTRHDSFIVLAHAVWHRR